MEKLINEYTNELIAFKVICREDNHLILIHRPRWFNDAQLKLQLVKRRS